MKRLKIAIAAVATALVCGGASGDSLISDGVVSDSSGTVTVVMPETGTVVVVERTSVYFSISLGEGVKSVSWTHALGRSSPTSVLTTESFTDDGILPGSTVCILDVQYEEWYEQADDGWVGWTKTLENPYEGISIKAMRIYQRLDGDGNVEVASDATPADVGISAGAFSAAGVSSDELGSVLTWNLRHNGGDSENIESILFDGKTALSTSAKAYLLNCSATEDAVEAASKEFRIDRFSPDALPRSSDFASMGYNGTVEILGAVTLGDWHQFDEDAGMVTIDGKSVAPKFFKAVLVRQ